MVAAELKGIEKSAAKVIKIWIPSKLTRLIKTVMVWCKKQPTEKCFGLFYKVKSTEIWKESNHWEKGTESDFQMRN